MDDRILGSLARPRMYAVLLVVFAVSALVIAGVGLVGVLSYTVAQRAREIALRIALGAKPRQVLALGCPQGLAVTRQGVSAGLVAAYVAARYLATLLYGVSVHDALSFVAVPVMLAAWRSRRARSPGLRAMRIDPLKQLRERRARITRKVRAMKWIVRGDVDGLLRSRHRQPGPAAADRRALPRRARLSGRPRLRPHPAGAGDLDSSSATSPTRCKRSASRSAPAAPTSARCRTASTPVSLFAHVFLVMLPAKALATAPARPTRARRVAGRPLRDAVARA
jgi:hypothetical protein